MSFIGFTEIESISTSEKQDRYTNLDARLEDKEKQLKSLQNFLAKKQEIKDCRVGRVRQDAYDSVENLSGTPAYEAINALEVQDNAVKNDNIISKATQGAERLENKVIKLKQEIRNIENEIFILEIKYYMKSFAEESLKKEYEKSLIENPIDLSRMVSPLAELQKRATLENPSIKDKRDFQKIVEILELIRFKQIELKLQIGNRERVWATDKDKRKIDSMKKDIRKLHQIIVDSIGTVSVQEIQEEGLGKQFVEKWKNVYIKCPESYTEILKNEEKETRGGVEKVRTGIAVYYRIKDLQKGEINLIIANKRPAGNWLNSNYEIGRIQFQLTDPQLINQKEKLLEIFHHLNSTFRGHMSLSEWGMGPGTGMPETNKDKFSKFLKENINLGDSSFQRKFACFRVSIDEKLDLVRAMEESDYPRGGYEDYEDDRGINSVKGEVIKETLEGLQPVGTAEIQNILKILEF